MRERARPQAGGAPHSVARVGAALAVVIRQRAPLAGAVSAACCRVLAWRWRRSHPGPSNYDPPGRGESSRAVGEERES